MCKYGLFIISGFVILGLALRMFASGYNQFCFFFLFRYYAFTDARLSILLDESLTAEDVITGDKLYDNKNQFQVFLSSVSLKLEHGLFDVRPHVAQSTNRQTSSNIHTGNT